MRRSSPTPCSRCTSPHCSGRASTCAIRAWRRCSPRVHARAPADAHHFTHSRIRTMAEVTHAAPAGAPVIANAGNKPRTPHKLFVNIPVKDVQASIRFFEALGFNFSPQFTDATATCMPVGQDAYVMMLTKERFAGFSKGKVGDPRDADSHLLTFSVNSREEVDAMVKKAIAA